MMQKTISILLLLKNSERETHYLEKWFPLSPYYLVVVGVWVILFRIHYKCAQGKKKSLSDVSL